MPIDPILTSEIIEKFENYIERKRPPKEIRNKLDIAYRIENQSIIIYEIRPRWDNPKEYIHSDIAKTTYVKSANHWKIFWQRADLKWYGYTPNPTVKKVSDFIKIVEEDKLGCFCG